MWKKLLLLATLGLIAAVLPGSPASAQATRTWVSGVGDDANPCSRTAPCKTWAGAISKTAAGGEIDALDPGGFGALTITKSITLDGGGGQVASTLVAGINGIVVLAASNDIVTIRNLRLDGLLGNGSNSGNAGVNGIRLISGAALSIENCDVFGFNTWAIDFEPNSAASLYVTNTTVTNNGVSTGGGILVKPIGAGPTKVVVSNTAMENGRAGMTVDGQSTSGPVTAAIENSVSSGNQKAGFTGSTTSGPVTFVLDHVVSNNNGTIGVQAVGAGAIVYLGNSTITGNNFGVSTTSSGQVLSYKTNQINGNTTSDGTPISAVPGGPLN